MQLSKLIWTFLMVSLCLSAFTAKASPTAAESSLMEFEEMVGKFRDYKKAVESGEIQDPVRVQQDDTEATEVLPVDDAPSYRRAVEDIYNGYQVFVLIDKSVSRRAGKLRRGDQRTPQTLYIYLRNSQDQLQLAKVVPVSTGRETAPGVADTHDGYFRLQSAQKRYTSQKFGEVMPFSLWFESEYGTAIHETPQARCDSAIGMRASAGCIRLCPGDAEAVFRLLTDPKFSRKSPIVLLDKQNGWPVGKGLRQRTIKKVTNEMGEIESYPKVIQGYPVFIRVIDGNSPEKIEEIQNLIQNPTENFRKYFRPLSQSLLDLLRV